MYGNIMMSSPVVSYLLYSWNALVYKNFEIERVCVELERELESLKEQARQR